MMNSLTGLPHWNHKIYDPLFVDTWKAGNLMTGPDVTRAMVDWVISNK